MAHNIYVWSGSFNDLTTEDQLAVAQLVASGKAVHRHRRRSPRAAQAEPLRRVAAQDGHRSDRRSGCMETARRNLIAATFSSNLARRLPVSRLPPNSAMS